MNAFFAGGNQGLAVQDGVHKVLHQDRVRIRRVLERNFDVPDLRFGEADFRRLAELDHVGFVAREEILSFSSSSFPRVPAISNRLVPGASPVEETNVPVAPFDIRDTR